MFEVYEAVAKRHTQYQDGAITLTELIQTLQVLLAQNPEQPWEQD